MRIGREHSEVPVRDVRTIQIWRWRRDADVGVRRVAVPGWRRRGSRAPRPRGTPELTDGAERVVSRRMAGRDHRRVGIRASAIHDREDSTIRVVANLEVVFVDEGPRAAAKARQIVSGFRPTGGVEFRSIDEHEPDSETPFDIQRVAINDPRDVALDAQADGTRARRRLRIRRRGRGIVPDGCGSDRWAARAEDGSDHHNRDRNRDEYGGSPRENHPTPNGLRVSSIPRTRGGREAAETAA